jgi:phospholipid/cholesterol/gamma-HCH transport system substrate-binding protein
MKNNKRSIEIVSGIFMLIGVICITYIALKMGDIGLWNENRYMIKAKFVSVSGLREGAYVEAAGVRVGKVTKIDFEPERYLASVTIDIDKNVAISEDAIASIRTAGIIGDKFIKISPGGADDYLEPGMEILETEPSINLEELISKYIFESGK